MSAETAASAPASPSISSFDVLAAGTRAVGAALTRPFLEAEALWLEFEDAITNGEGPLPELVRRFGLGRFETRCLMLALSAHVDPQLPSLVAASGVAGLTSTTTVRVALDRLCDGPEAQLAARRAFLPSAPLIAHRLVLLGRSELGASEGLLGRRLDV